MDTKKFIPQCAFALPAYWDRTRVERIRERLVVIRKQDWPIDNFAIDDAVALLYYVLNPDKISHDTSDGPVGMDEVDHD